MTAVVFLGPTLPVGLARAHLDACYLPPVQQGDVLRALKRRPRAIAIVDGYFDLVPSVWHKEILAAMAAGVHVFGASSMGALRAAELHDFGMVGVGAVFDAYVRGDLEDDDEVAVVHGPPESGFVPLSDAMVDIRDALDAATTAGAVDVGFAARVTDLAKQLHYRERSWRRVLSRARTQGENCDALDRLNRFIAAPRQRVKARDAIALLDLVSQFLATDPPPLCVSWALERTYRFRELVGEVSG